MRHDSPQFRRRLQFSKRDYQEILGRMQAGELGNPKADLRARPRYGYQIADIPLCIEHPEGGSSFFLVYGRNISRRGLSVLHGGFVHPGSTCKIVLPQMDGETLTISGEVRHCRLVAGSCHEIGILFHEEVNTALLVGSGTGTEVKAVEGPVKFLRTDGTILLAESFAPDHLILEHHLSIFGLDIHIAETPGASLDAIQQEQVDMVLFGLSLSGTDGIRTLRRMRDTGYRGPIVVLTAETDARILDAARRVGITDIINKPYNIDLLIAQLQVHLGEGEPERPLYSTAADQPGMPPLIGQFVGLVRRIADQVERTRAEEEWSELREYCMQLKGSGCSYGFQTLTVTAITAVNALDEDPNSDPAREAVELLLERCRSLEFNQPVDRASEATSAA